jgi:two-component system, LytTR family, response regulator AgrA
VGELLNVIICEDNKIERDRIQSYIKHSIEINKYDCIITMSTDDPMDAIQYAKNHSGEVNVYFLDVDLNSRINGIEAARLIRDVDINGYFIFITGHSEYSMMTFQYKLKALDYLDKSDFPKLSNKINQCMKTVFNENSNMHDVKKDIGLVISIKSGSRLFNIPVRDILYFETIADHKIKVRTIANSIEYYETLGSILTKLMDNNFHMIHRSYIVNMDHVFVINHEDMTVTMNNGEVCQMSRRFAKGLSKK